jgi:hypothetical protein
MMRRKVGIRKLLMMLSCVVAVGCLENDKANSGLDSEIVEQQEILSRRRLELDEQRARHQELVELQRNAKEGAILQEEIVRIETEIEMVQSEIALSQAERELVMRELNRSRGKVREEVRRAFEGRMINLSETKGPGYEEVRVFKILPTGIKIQLPSGTETVSLSEIPLDLREKFLMSEEEAESYRERLAESASLRARALRERREERKKRSGEQEEDMVLRRITEIEEEILRIEKRVDLRARKVTELTSIASDWELKAAEAKTGRQKQRAIRYSLNYREEAREVAEGNSRALEVISILLKEISELKKELGRDSGSGL